MIHWSIIFLGLIVGIPIGVAIEAYSWRLTSKGPAGRFSKGQIFHVIEENDDSRWRGQINLRRYLIGKEFRS